VALDKEIDMPQNTVPIPGQSIMREPGNAPYERPPEIQGKGAVEKVLRGYMNHLNDAKVLEGAMGLLEQGMSVNTLVQGMLRGGVAGGVHNIDVSLIIEKTLADFIINIADTVGVDYTVGDEEEELDTSDADLLQLARENRPDTSDMFAPIQEEEIIEEPIEEDKPVRQGLMARGQ
jgi:hypothetical protein|tara:strand:- start:506 stop:1033 length:528 start_codon:yes stop_codon:yes gene_type:complete